MKRKVVKHGPSTFVVSLPSNWVKKHNILKGNELDVVEQGDQLYIGNNVIPKSLEANINISNLDRTSVFYVIRGFYRAGYDGLKITFNKSTIIYQRENKELNVLSVIHSEINRLVGYEILEEGKNHCLIRDIQAASGRNFEQALRRIFLLLTNAVQEFVQAIKENNFQYLSVIRDEKHDTITKFISYCLRMINKQIYTDQQESFHFQRILFHLEDITDTLRYVSRSLLNNNRSSSKNMQKILDNLEKSMISFEKLFYKYDEKKIMEINNLRYETEKEINSLSSQADSKTAMAAQWLYQIFLDIDLMISTTILYQLKKGKI
ncbi:phosphate uptake regulator PhoU [Candidatus Woesearchaeota archaeon]|nr:phosphate uptake regulator PhoU [Candidatus Woesearchaeota archaeon]